MVPIGVGLIVIARDTGRMLVLKELKSKPLVKKQAGMISFPLETVKNGESLQQTVQRLIVEEIGVEINAEPRFFCDPMVIIPGTQTAGACTSVEREFVARPKDIDVAYQGWMDIDELLHEEAFVREETVPLLKKYINHCDFRVD